MVKTFPDAQTEADFLQAKANYVSATSNFNIARTTIKSLKLYMINN